MIEYNAIDPTLSANDLHDLMLHIHDIFHIEDVELKIKEIVCRFSPNISPEYIESKSFDLKKIMLNLGRHIDDPNNNHLPVEWDYEWQKLALDSNYKEFAELGLLHRNTFQKIRESYLMYQVCSKILEGPPRMGIMQYITAKYIDDVLINSHDNSKFKIMHESFEGENETMIIRGGLFSPEKLEEKPTPHWVGKTIFDSFYMIPVLEHKKNKWEFLPIELIRSIQYVREHHMESDEGYIDF